jgi:uncharacterized repeat protein (TIGR03943 family)
VVDLLTAAGGTVSLLVGTVLLRLTFAHTYERYVRVSMGRWLLVAGIALILLGLLTLVRAVRRTQTEHAHEDHDHDHAGGIGVGWLLLAPIAALLLVAPPTLGAYGVGRAATVNVRAGKTVFKKLKPAQGPVPMTLLEFAQRAFDHNGASFNHVPVQLTGFSAGSDGGGFKLARYTIACCAADAAPLVIRVVGTSGQIPSNDQWVNVTGLWKPGGGNTPQITATTVVQIPAPEDPYE